MLLHSIYFYSIPFYYGIFYSIICLLFEETTLHCSYTGNYHFSILVRFLILVQEFSGLQIHIQIYPDTEQLFRQTL